MPYFRITATSRIPRELLEEVVIMNGDRSRRSKRRRKQKTRSDDQFIEVRGGGYRNEFVVKKPVEFYGRQRSRREYLVENGARRSVSRRPPRVRDVNERIYFVDDENDSSEFNSIYFNEGFDEQRSVPYFEETSNERFVPYVETAQHTTWNLPNPPQFEVVYNESARVGAESLEGDEEGGVVRIINQPPLKNKFEEWKVIGDQPENLIEGHRSSSESSSRHKSAIGSANLLKQSTGEYNVNDDQSRRMKSSIKSYEKQEVHENHTHQINDSGSNYHKTLSTLNESAIPEYAVVNNKDKAGPYDKVNFNQKQNRKSSNKLLTEEVGSVQHKALVHHTTKNHLWTTTNNQNYEISKQQKTQESSLPQALGVTSKPVVIETPIQTRKEAMSGRDNWDRVLRRLKEDKDRVGKTREDWISWMEEQRFKNRKQPNDVPIPSESVVVEGEGTNLTPPMRRPRVNTALVEPIESDFTDHNGGFEEGPENHFEDDEEYFEDQIDSKSKSKETKPFFMKMMKNSLSPRKDEHIILDKIKDIPKKIKEIPEKLKEIPENLKKHLSHEASPWGRLKSCGNRETCGELKERIRGRTVFMTPTYTNAEYARETEVSLDRLPDSSRDFFVSRCVENHDEEEGDGTVEEREGVKSGGYVRLYCEKCNHWETESCHGKE